MKTLFAILSLFSFASAAQAASVTVLSCRSIRGTRAHGTLTTANVVVQDERVLLQVQNCRGVLNWGCGNGMDDLVDVGIPVTTEDGNNYDGTQGSLRLNGDGTYSVDVPGFRHLFAEGECERRQ
jgi:hypothetical protein